MAVPADRWGGHRYASLNHLVGCSIQASGGLERVCPSTKPVESEVICISDNEQKSQGPMCSVEWENTS